MRSGHAAARGRARDAEAVDRRHDLRRCWRDRHGARGARPGPRALVGERPRSRRPTTGAAPRRLPQRATEHHLGWATSDGRRRPAAARASGPPSPCCRPRPSAPSAEVGRARRRRRRAGAQLLAAPRRHHRRRPASAGTAPRCGRCSASGPALLVGDALHTLAFQVLLENPAAAATPIGQRLATSAAAMIDGQSSDMAFESQERVSVDDCRDDGRGQDRRPARLRGVVGAVLAGADDSTVDALDAYGLHLGPRLPGRRRPARDLGLAGGDRQAGRIRPAVEEEDAAGRAGHGRRRRRGRRAVRAVPNGPLDGGRWPGRRP